MSILFTKINIHFPVILDIIQFSAPPLCSRRASQEIIPNFLHRITKIEALFTLTHWRHFSFDSRIKICVHLNRLSSIAAFFGFVCRKLSRNRCRESGILSWRSFHFYAMRKKCQSSHPTPNATRKLFDFFSKYSCMTKLIHIVGDKIVQIKKNMRFTTFNV